MIENLLSQADKLIIGGGMVFTFLRAQGHEVGKSLLEDDQVDTCLAYLQRAEGLGVELMLPTDVVVDTEFPSGDREAEPASYPPPISLRTASASTSAPIRRRPSPPLSTGRGPFSGTDPWASSRPPPSPTGPEPWPRR